MTTVNIGIDNPGIIADALSRYLANSYSLYLKTQNFHWNVTGPNFQALHTMFEEHYTELAAAVDEIAERIRALGVKAPGSFSAFAKLADIAEAGENVAASDMVAQLASDHQTMSRMGRELLALAGKESDEVTCGLIAARMEIHEKTAWMLRSSL
jgi:starvation-inducible DNA-binding protein